MTDEEIAAAAASAKAKEEGDNANPSGKEGKESSKEEPKSFSQDEVNGIIRDRLKREKDSIRTEILAELQKKSDEDAAIKAGEWEKVVKGKDQEIDGLKNLVSVVTEFEKLANDRFEEAKKKLPEALMIMAPDDDAPALEKEKWYTKKALPALATLEKELGKTLSKKGLNANEDPKPGEKRRDKDIKDIMEIYSNSGQYTF